VSTDVIEAMMRSGHTPSPAAVVVTPASNRS
jgi:hypothetical protein